MSQTIVMPVQCTRQEIVTACWAYLPAALSFRRRAWAFFLVGAAVIGLIGLIGDSVIWVVGIPVVGLSVLSAVVLQKRQLGRAADRAGFTKPTTLTATPEGLRVENDTSDLFFRWSNYERIAETGDGFVLISRGGATVRWIPFRSFQRSDDGSQLLAWAESGLST